MNAVFRFRGCIMKNARFFVLAIVAALVGLATAPAAVTPTSAATTFVVNSTGDAADASPGNGVCATAGAVCTLRAAIQKANALAGADTINFNIPTGQPNCVGATNRYAQSHRLLLCPK
jgi:CSLREA domain-containing protein